MKLFNRSTGIFVVLILFVANAMAQEGKPKELTIDGIKVIFKPSIKEITSARLFIRGGTANYSKELEGVENLALALVTEGGTQNKTKTEFATALESIGTEIGYSTAFDYSEISLSCVQTYWDKSWSLFAEPARERLPGSRGRVP